MIEIDGKALDLTNPAMWGGSIKLNPNGFVSQRKDGIETVVYGHSPNCASNIVLTSYPSQYQKYNCKEAK